jgi:hypothetical protein
VVMEFSGEGFSAGVLDCFKIGAREREALARMAVQRANALEQRDAARAAEIDKQREETMSAYARPLWQRVSGLGSALEREMEPHLRRGCVLQLVKLFERVLRAEMQRGADAAVMEVRSVFWDPVSEICVYLGIAQEKLSRYCVELTGLRAREFSDKVRVEKLRPVLKAALGGVFQQYLSRAGKLERMELKRAGLKNCVARMMRVIRTKGVPYPTRQELALEVGLSSKQKLHRAVLASEGVALEMLEAELAEDVLREWLATDEVQSWTEDAFRAELEAELERRAAEMQIRRGRGMGGGEMRGD